MAIITLTSDLGLKDYYVSAIKGNILKQYPEATIIDISHQVPAFNIQQAAYILKNAYPHFPDGSIHIVGVDAEHGIDTPHIALYTDKQYFIGADNGIFSLMFDKKADKIVELNLQLDTNSLTFPLKDVFVQAACHIARGGTLEVIGKETKALNEKTMFRPVVEQNAIRGTVIYIDSYYNIITNINRTLFKEVGKGKSFSIRFVKYEINRISTSYQEVSEGEILAMFNSAGYLEIAMNKGNASSLFNIHLGDIITIYFE